MAPLEFSHGMLFGGLGARAYDALAVSIGSEGHTVNSIIWWVGAIVIILAILGFLGIR